MASTPTTLGSPHLTDPERLAAVRATGLVGTGPEETFDRLARLTASLLDAPLAFVTMCDDQRSWWKSAIGVPFDAEMSTPIEASFCQYVIADQSPVVVEDARDQPRMRHNPSVEAMGLVASAGAPITGPQGLVLGALVAVDTRPHAWTDRDVEVLRALAAAASAEIALRVSLAAEREQRARAEAALAELGQAHASLRTTARRAEAIARTLRASLLPSRLPDLPGLSVGARYRTAGDGPLEVTGDFYDTYRAGVRGDAWAVVIGDVCGKGPAAAALTAECRYSVRAEATHTAVPSRVLAGANDVLREDSPDERFVTAAFMVLRADILRPGRIVDMPLPTLGERHWRPAEGGLDGATWRGKVALAGHHQPLIRRADGTVVAIGHHGLPLGLFPDAQIRDDSFRLWPGDAVVLYTDGLVEARRAGEELGVERLCEILSAARGTSASALVRELDAAVLDYSDGTARDDTAIVAVLVEQQHSRRVR